jgi:hypothetical protein|tara:strand:- start:295 stop:540 length:246 start_codon:yes stop_codon:yes gene_type:complete
MDQDLVNHPPHYTSGRVETIDFIEDCVQQAPDAVVGGLQWQVLKYMSRLWLKDSPALDAGKARFYLDRLIRTLEKPEYNIE